MSGAVFQFVAKRVLKEAAVKNINAKDPYYEYVEEIKHGKTITVQKKKSISPLLNAQDRNILKKVRRRAYRLDMSLFNCCGIRFGWSSVIGFIPIIGDFIDLFFGYMLVRTCSQVQGGLPPVLLSKMYFNLMLDFGLGLVPFLGDIADAVFRANTRNCWLLDEYLNQRAEALLSTQKSDRPIEIHSDNEARPSGTHSPPVVPPKDEPRRPPAARPARK